jgi:hypothetical protein
MLKSNLVETWSLFNEFFDDLYNFDIPSLHHQIELFESLGLIIVSDGKEKLMPG